MAEKNDKYFFCKDCFASWKTSEYYNNKGEDDEIDFSICEQCGKSCHETPHYYFNLPKMMEAKKGKSTGPKTPEGKKRSSLNNYKHGLYTKQKIFLAPTQKDKYPECPECPYRDDCGTKYKYCPLNLSLITRFAAAYESGDIETIKEFAGLMQGNAAITLKLLFNDIFQHGTLKEKHIIKKISEADDGESIEENIIIEMQGNPSLKRIPEFMTLLGATAEQQIMTPAKKIEDDNVKGFIKTENVKAENIKDYIDNRANCIKDLKDKLMEAQKNRAADETLSEFEEETAQDE